MPGYFFVVHIWSLEAYLAQQICGHETDAIIFVLQPLFFNKYIEPLFNTVLCQYGLICDDVGFCSGFNKGDNIIYGIAIGLRIIVEGMWANNLVAPEYGFPIVSSIIAVDSGRIM